MRIYTAIQNYISAFLGYLFVNTYIKDSTNNPHFPVALFNNTQNYYLQTEHDAYRDFCDPKDLSDIIVFLSFIYLLKKSRHNYYHVECC